MLQLQLQVAVPQLPHSDSQSSSTASTWSSS